MKCPVSVDEDETTIQGFQLQDDEDDDSTPAFEEEADVSTLAPNNFDDVDIDDVILDDSDDESLPTITEIGGAQQLPVDIDADRLSQVVNNDLHNGNNMSAVYDIFNVRTPISNNLPSLVGGSINSSNVNIELEVDLCGAHRIVRADVSELNSNRILYPNLFVDKVNSQLKSMGAIKVQFGIVSEWAKKEERKLFTFSNYAKPLDDEFVNNEILSLNNKIEAMTKLGSDWKLVKITEVFFILTRISNICRLSGSSFIDTPEYLRVKKAVINVKNDDEKCFFV